MKKVNLLRPHDRELNTLFKSLRSQKANIVTTKDVCSIEEDVCIDYFLNNIPIEHEAVILGGDSFIKDTKEQWDAIFKHNGKISMSNKRITGWRKFAKENLKYKIRKNSSFISPEIEGFSFFDINPL